MISDFSVFVQIIQVILHPLTLPVTYVYCITTTINACDKYSDPLSTWIQRMQSSTPIFQENFTKKLFYTPIT